MKCSNCEELKGKIERLRTALRPLLQRHEEWINTRPDVRTHDALEIMETNIRPKMDDLYAAMDALDESET